MQCTQCLNTLHLKSQKPALVGKKRKEESIQVLKNLLPTNSSSDQ